MAKELIRFNWFNFTAFYVKGFKSFTTNIGTPIAQVWNPISIKRSKVRHTMEDNIFSVTMQTDQNPAALFRVTNKDIPIIITIFDENLAVQAVGHFKSIERDTNAGTAELKFASISLHLEANIPFDTYGPLCRFFLYDDNCGILETDSDPNGVAFRETFDYEDAETITDNTIIVLNSVKIIGNPIYKNTWWETGWATKGNEKILIIGHVSSDSPDKSTITLMRPFSDTDDGVVTLQAGCLKREIIDCFGKFDNQDNFGGQKHVRVNPITEGF